MIGIVLVLLCLLGGGALGFSDATAAPVQPEAEMVALTVDTTSDEPDATPGDGLCDISGGTCSLRAALMDANALAGTDTIAFNLSGGSLVISPFSELPEISDPVILDGTAQPGFVSTPLVTLDGSQAGANARDLVIRSGLSTVRSLQIMRFAGTGIEISGPGQNVISGNVIGGIGTVTDPCGKWPFLSLPIDLGLMNNASPRDMNDCGQVVGGRFQQSCLFVTFPITPARLTVSTPVTIALYYEGGAHTITETLTVQAALPWWEIFLPDVKKP